MAKIHKYELSWKPSESQNITGYKIYWSKSETVNYDSKYIDVGNVTSITLPDDITFSDSAVMFGVTAIDKDGNESDITTFGKPYQFHVPKSAKELSLRPLEDFSIIDTIKPQSKTPQKVDKLSFDEDDGYDPFVDAVASNIGINKAKIKYYDDVGYRQSTNVAER